MYKIKINVLVYKHKQYNYIGVTKFRDFIITNYYFVENLKTFINIEPTYICITKISAMNIIESVRGCSAK